MLYRQETRRQYEGRSSWQAKLSATGLVYSLLELEPYHGKPSSLLAYHAGTARGLHADHARIL
jgi:hypothetical protein